MKINKKFICTKQNPWSIEKSRKAIHPDAKLINSIDGEYDSYDVYKCPYCGKIFKETIAK